MHWELVNAGTSSLLHSPLSVSPSCLSLFLSFFVFALVFCCCCCCCCLSTDAIGSLDFFLKSFITITWKRRFVLSLFFFPLLIWSQSIMRFVYGCNNTSVVMLSLQAEIVGVWPFVLVSRIWIFSF